MAHRIAACTAQTFTNFYTTLLPHTLPSAWIRPSLDTIPTPCHLRSPSSPGRIQGELIIGADGVKSCIQQVVSGKPHPAELTGDAVYRVTVPASLMMQDPELCEFIVHPQMIVWLGISLDIPLCAHLLFMFRLRYADHMNSSCRGGRSCIISSYCTQMMDQSNRGL